MATGLEPTGSVPDWKPDVDSTHIGDELVMATSAQVQQLYIALLGRAADKPGLDWWLENINGGERTLEQAAAAFTTSEEFVSTYGSLQGAELVTAVYSNLFERTPSQEEVTYWVNDGRPADQLLAAFLAYASPADQTVINNKVFVAQAYSNATGDDYNLDAAAQIVADVNGTTASITAALNLLENGVLPGNVPGLALIQAQKAAAAKYIAEQKAAYEALSAADKAAYSAGDKLLDAAEAKSMLDDAQNARDGVSLYSTRVLEANLADENEDLAAAKAAAIAVTGGAKAVANYESAVATLKAAQDKVDDVDLVAKAAADAGLGVALADTDATVNFAALEALVKDGSGTTFANIGDLYAFLEDPATTSYERGNVVNAIKDLPYASQVVGYANDQLAVAKAQAALGTAATVGAPVSANLVTASTVTQGGGAGSATEVSAVTFSDVAAGDTVTVGNVDLTAAAAMTGAQVADYFLNATVTGWTAASTLAANELLFTSTNVGQDVTDLTASSTTLPPVAGTGTIGAVEALGAAGKDYLDEAEQQQIAQQELKDAQEKDQDVVAAKAVYDKLAAFAKAEQDAQLALAKFDNDNADIALENLTGNGVNAQAGTSGHDVFYFGGKAAAGDDFVISGFGAAGNDFIVLGDDYSFNNGALTAGDNNVLEFFLVQGSAGAQLVIEETAFGSNATADSVATITLTGVNVDQLSFDNGVISFVA